MPFLIGSSVHILGDAGMSYFIEQLSSHLRGCWDARYHKEDARMLCPIYHICSVHIIEYTMRLCLTYQIGSHPKRCWGCHILYISSVSAGITMLYRESLFTSHEMQGCRASFISSVHIPKDVAMSWFSGNLSWYGDAVLPRAAFFYISRDAGAAMLHLSAGIIMFVISDQFTSEEMQGCWISCISWNIIWNLGLSCFIGRSVHISVDAGMPCCIKQIGSRLNKSWDVVFYKAECFTSQQMLGCHNSSDAQLHISAWYRLEY